MAGKRDAIVAIVIILTFFFVGGFFILLFLGTWGEDDGISISGGGARIAVVDVFGTITEAQPIVKQLKKWGKSSSVKGIVIHVDSPGGGVAPSQEIYDAIRKVRDEEEKVVVVSMSSLAASGGYYIACAADRIVANPGTLTGSIGVILQFLTAEKLMQKIGIGFERVKSGDLKDVGALDRAMTDKEREMLTAVIMDTYEQFVEVVAEGRELDKDDVYQLANGAIYTGRQAYGLGLVDTLGTFDDAVQIAAELAGIKGEPQTIQEPKPKKGLWDLLGVGMNEIKETVQGESGGPRIMYLY